MSEWVYYLHPLRTCWGPGLANPDVAWRNAPQLPHLPQPRTPPTTQETHTHRHAKTGYLEALEINQFLNNKIISHFVKHIAAGQYFSVFSHCRRLGVVVTIPAGELRVGSAPGHSGFSRRSLRARGTFDLFSSNVLPT